jgi:Spy/CpxP family protein refolding chaperone
MGGGRFTPSPADLKKMQDLTTKATSSIDAVLTPAQKKELPGALKEIGTMRNAGIPLETLGDLKLTSTQKTKIASIADKAQKDMEVKVKAANGDFQSLMPAIQQARAKTHTDVMATLTASQKAVVEKYEKDHPRRGFGGGMGGPGGGGRRGGGPGGPGGPGGRPGA